MNLDTVFKRRQWNTDCLLREPAEVYHPQRREYLTSHQLADFRKNPLLYKKKLDGLIVDEDKPSFQVGRAAHVLILEGPKAYHERHAFRGPINEKTGEPFGKYTKAFTEWEAEQGKPVLTDEQITLVENLHRSVYAHDNASALLSEGVPEGVVRAEYCGVPSQARLDWLNPERGIIDLKTCDNLDWLQMDTRTYGYAHQFAFYRAVLACVIGTKLPVYLIAVEKREPYRCGVWRMAEDVLGSAERENEEAITRIKSCLEHDHWPTGYEEVRNFDWI
jgi:hypothetical protein